MESKSETIAVGDIPFVSTDLQAAVDWFLFQVVSRRTPLNVRLANAYCVALADSDSEYRSLLVNHGVNLPDGAPVVWAMNTVGKTGRQSNRVRGPSFFEECLKQSANGAVRHFFLGGTPDTLTQLEVRLKSRFPGLQIAGAYSPPFGPADDAFIAACAGPILDARADLVWVGLGTPKQDFVGTRLSEQLGLPSANVGAAFNFLAGTTKEAPKWIQNSGFEWLFRLISEPRRLWKRYFFGNARFLSATLRGALQARRKRR